MEQMKEQTAQGRHVSEALKSYSPSDSAIAQMREDYMGLAINDLENKQEFQAVRTARMHVRTARVSVEKKRVELKADALNYGRRVDAEAKRITAQLLPIEQHLQAEEVKVEAEKARLQRVADDERAARLKDRMKALQAVGSLLMPPEYSALEAEEFRDLLARETAVAAARRAEEDAAAQALQLEKDEMAAEHKRLEEEAARQRAAVVEIEHEQAKLDADRKRVADQLAASRREEELATARKEAAAEEAARAKAKAKAKKDREAAATARAERLEAMKPEVQKMREFSALVVGLDVPGGSYADKILAILTLAGAAISRLADEMETGV